MQDRSFDGRRGERGFALVLAILSLMLLTFLGLTMAATTSTELQIATNYRWSQQALYNAEAGLEAARIELATVAGIGSQWSTVLPPVRVSLTGWEQNKGAVLSGTGRDYERNTCEGTVGDGIGYGRVLDGTTRFENIPGYNGSSVNGAFTVWVRRGLIVNTEGYYNDDPANDKLIIVSEGVAPYDGGFTGQASTLLRSRQAVRLLETRYTLNVSPGVDPCGVNRMAGQEGGSPMGENFNPCVDATAAALGGLLPPGGSSNTGVR